MTYFNFPHIEEDDNLKNLRNDVKSFLKTTFNSNNIKPQADAWMYSANPEFSKKLGEKGWLGMSFPKKYGGREKTMLERYVITEELLVAGAPVAAHWIADRQSGSQIIRYGTEEQKKEIIPKISSGECFFAIGMSEPDSGSDLASVKTFAKKTADGWALTGRKIWSTGAHLSHYMIVLARTEKLDEKNRHSGLSQFLVNLKLPGVEINPIEDMTHQKHFNETVFNNVKLNKDALLGEEGMGWQQVVGELALERSGPERFLSHYILLDNFISEFRYKMSEMGITSLGKIISELQTLRMMSFSIAWMIQEKKSPDVQAAFVKEAGNVFEKKLIETIREMSNLIPFEEWSSSLKSLFQDATLRVPANSLRGGTSEIMRGIISKQLGLR